MKAIALDEARSRLDELFEDAQAGSPVLLVRGGELAKLERVAPPEFGGDLAALERMLIERSGRTASGVDAARPGGHRSARAGEAGRMSLKVERAIHGASDLRRRLTQPPGVEDP